MITNRLPPEKLEVEYIDERDFISKILEVDAIESLVEDIHFILPKYGETFGPMTDSIGSCVKFLLLSPKNRKPGEDSSHYRITVERIIDK